VRQSCFCGATDAYIRLDDHGVATGTSDRTSQRIPRTRTLLPLDVDFYHLNYLRLRPSTMYATKPKAIHFGAGNIGRGFIAPLLSGAGYTVVFAGRQPDVIAKLNDENTYDVHVLDQDAHTFAVEDVMGVLSTSDAMVRAIADPNAHVLTTAVGPTSLEKIAPTIAAGLVRRRKIGGDVLNIIACEVGTFITCPPFPC
jgi:mannitol-1-phosphate/altronate dehydrogenase